MAWQEGIWFPKLDTLYYLQCIMFHNNNKITRHPKETRFHTETEKRKNRNCLWGNPDTELTRQRLKSATLKVSKWLNEIMSKNLRKYENYVSPKRKYQ